MEPLRLTCLACLLCLAAPVAAAADDGKPAKPDAAKPDTAAARPDLTPDALRTSIKQLEDNKDLKEDVRKKAIELLRQALEQQKVHQAWQLRVGDATRLTAEAPERFKRLKERMAKPAGPVPTVDTSLTLPELEAGLATVKAKLGEAAKALEELEAEPKRRAERRRRVPNATQAAKAALDDVRKQLAETQAGEAAEVAKARRALLRLREWALAAELESYARELVSYEATAELLPLERDAAVREVAAAKALADAHQKALLAVRQRMAEAATRKAADAKREAAGKHPLAGRLARENEELAARRSGPRGLLAELEDANRRGTTAAKDLAKLRETVKSLKDKVARTGVTSASAQLLRHEQTAVWAYQRQRHQAGRLRSQIGRIQGVLLELEDQRGQLADLDARIDDAGRQQGEAAAQLRTLYESKRDLLDGLIGDHQTLFSKLIELEATQRDLVKEADAFADYIGEQTLWQRSAGTLGPRDVAAAATAARELFTWANVQEALDALRADVGGRPTLAGFAALAFLVIFLVQSWARRRLAYIGGLVASDYLYTFFATFRAALLTMLIAGCWPALGAFVAWRLLSNPDAGDFSRAVAMALVAAVCVGGTIDVLRAIFRHNGLGEAHFRWKGPLLKTVRRDLWFLRFAVLPAAILVGLTEAMPGDAARGTLGRLGFLLGVAGYGLFLWRTVRPGGPVARELFPDLGGLRGAAFWAWHVTLLALPATLFAMAVEGHYFTALQLAQRCLATLWVALALLLVNALVVRWLFAARGRLAVQRAQERKDAAAAGAAGQADAAGPDANEVDLAIVNRHSRRLVRSLTVAVVVLCGWVVWAEMLPGLPALAQRPLWTAVAARTEVVARPDGAGSETRTVEEVVSITPAHVAAAGAVLWLCLLVAGTLPGVLEIVASPKLGLDAGGRYALATLLQYVVATIGIFASTQVVGLHWGQVQWLAAGMTVGLGFGLQEIFANFVSGLILLFERPIRVGDTVTVGDITGTVTRIRIRSTTIADGNRRELVVPNKEFVTGKVINWTLSDRTARLLIRVAVPNDTDVEGALNALRDIADQHPDVMVDPAPQITFDLIGESRLELLLNVVVPNLDAAARAKHAMNLAIVRKFRDLGIALANPQREVTLRDGPALVLRRRESA